MLASPMLMAGFATYSTDWPDDACIVNEKITNLEKKPCEPPDPKLVIAPEAKPTRVAECRRLYGKFGATFLTADIRDITNTSGTALSSGVILTTSTKENYVSWEAGLGTKLQYVRVEVDYLYEKN